MSESLTNEKEIHERLQTYSDISAKMDSPAMFHYRQDVAYLLAALSSSQDENKKLKRDYEFEGERASLFAHGVGIARLKLQPRPEIDPAGALEALDHYNARIKELSRATYPEFYAALTTDNE